MEKYTDYTKFRTEGDLRLAKVTLRHKSSVQERVISETFSNFGEYLMNSVKLAAIHVGTTILTTALIKLIQSRSK